MQNIWRVDFISLVYYRIVTKTSAIVSSFYQTNGNAAVLVLLYSFILVQLEIGLLKSKSNKLEKSVFSVLNVKKRTAFRDLTSLIRGN